MPSQISSIFLSWLANKHLLHTSLLLNRVTEPTGVRVIQPTVECGIWLPEKRLGVRDVAQGCRRSWLPGSGTVTNGTTDKGSRQTDTFAPVLSCVGKVKVTLLKSCQRSLEGAVCLSSCTPGNRRAGMTTHCTALFHIFPYITFISSSPLLPQLTSWKWSISP